MKRDPKPTAARPRQARRAAPAAAPAIEAAADIDRVVELYCQELISKGYDDPEYWWWPRAVWADPNQLIVDGENGSLYRVAFSTNDQQEVTFADPVEVLETFTDLEPAAKARVLVSAARDTGSRAPSRVYASREDTPAAPKTEPEGGVDEGGNNVGMNREQLCAALGLPADATDEQIDAKTAELAAADPAEGGDGGQGGGEPDPAPAGEGGEGGEGGEPDPAPAASAQLPEGMVAVPADIWESVQTGAIAGGQLAEQAEVTNRDSTIVAATAAGKISPSAKESMVNLHARDKEAFYKLLTASVSEGGLAPNLIPVAQRGGAATATGATPGPGGGPGAMVPGGQVPAEAGGEYVPPERMVALFGKQYAPPAPDASGMTVIGAQ